MAKNKVKIDVSVDDKGSTRKVGVGAKKAADGLDKVGTSAHSTDRRLKGASQQSSNTTKNFSKMAQGISGGLVPAYATLASTLFAVSAAFNFLKQAGQLATLQAGQVAYASATGTGLRTLANEIGRATDNMITFKDASEAAAIGTAAGLSPDQLTRLGKAAKDVSIILGRDVTDSFNRLVRGVTKAEPELLDELGIILRLDDASQKYAQAMGIVGRELTTFEKSQAVTNDVLTQSEEKYGRILEILEVQPNVYAQLGKAFDDITNKVKALADKALAPLARILTDTPELAIAAFGLFGASIVKNIIPGLGQLGTASKAAMQQSMASTSAATASLISYNNALRAGRGDKAAGKALFASAGAGAQKTLQATGQKFTGSYKTAMTDPSKLTKKQIQVMISDYKKGSGQIMLLSKKQRSALIKDLKDLELANKVAQGKITTDTQIAHNKLRIMATTTKNVFVVAFNGMKVAAAGLGRALGMLMGAFGWVSLLITAGMMIKDYINNNKELTASQREAIEEEEKRKQAVEDLTLKFQGLNNELSKMPEVLAEITKEGKGDFATLFNMLGKSAGNLSQGEIVSGLDALSPAIKQQVADTEALEQAQMRLMAANDARQFHVDPNTGQRKRDGDFKSAGLFSGAGKSAISDMDFVALGQEQIAAEKEFNALSEKVQDAGFTKQQKRVKEFYTNRLASLKAANTEEVQSSTRVAGEIEAIESFLTTGIIGELAERTKATVDFQRNVTAPYKKQAADNAKAAQSLLQGFLPPSKYDNMVAALKTEQELLTNMKEDADRLDITNAENNLLQDRINLFKELADIERRHAKEKLALTVATQNLNLKATPLQAQQLALQIKELQQVQKIRHLEQQIASTKAVTLDKQTRLVVKNDEAILTKREMTAQEEHTLSLNQLQLETEQGKLEAIQMQLDTQHQLNQAFKAGFEGATTKGFNDLITGEQSSFGDAALGSVRGGLEGMAGQLSQQMSRGVSDSLFGSVGIDREKSADEVLSGAYDASSKALRVVMSADPNDTTPLKNSINPEDPEGGLVNQIKEGSKSFAADFKGIWTDGNNSFKDKISKTFDLGGNTFKNIFDGFSDGFKDIMSGIGEGLRGFFGSFGGGARYGGIMKGYSEGGIARGKQAGYPAILHGTEAVVPLPSGEKIPVEMKGGAGGSIVNNISVTVNNEGKATTDMSSTSGEMGDQKAKQLGNLISASVQEEIIKQQRPGGLLSPIGVGA